MKKSFFAALILALTLLLFACSDGEAEQNETQFNAQDYIDEVFNEADEVQSFSEAAVERYLKSIDGLEIDAIKPDWEYTVGNYGAYADDPSSGYGHAVIAFTKASGELAEDEYDTWLTKVFNATASASQDGYNIIGYEFAGDGEDALAETTLEDAVSGFISGWAFRKNDKIYVVYVSKEYDSEKESELGSLFYYNKIKIDVGAGLQKSFNDTLGEAESYFEEYSDEIKDAIDDYLG